MADAAGSVDRNRAVFIFVIGLIVLVSVFLGGLFVSAQRSGQLTQLAAGDGAAQADSKTEKKAEEKPKEAPQESPKGETKPEDKTGHQTQKPPADPKENEVKPEPEPRTTPPAVAATGPSGELPATGPSGWIIVPILLVLGYAAFEHRRSRRALQRAALQESGPFLTFSK